jgi:hypothetical protein
MCFLCFAEAGYFSAFCANQIYSTLKSKFPTFIPESLYSQTPRILSLRQTPRTLLCNRPLLELLSPFYVSSMNVTTWVESNNTVGKISSFAQCSVQAVKQSFIIIKVIFLFMNFIISLSFHELHVLKPFSFFVSFRVHLILKGLEEMFKIPLF